MYTQELVDALANRAYEAMLDFERWPSFLVHLANAMGGCSPMLYRHDRSNHLGSVNIQVDCDPAVMRAYTEYLSSRNVWLRGGVQHLTVGRVRTSHMMCSKSVLLRSQWWADFCRPLGITQGLGATILEHGDLTYNISVCADDSRSPFGGEDLRFMIALMPHLQRALRVSMHLGETQVHDAGLAVALDRLPTAVFLVAANARVLYLNRAAEALVASGGGLSIDKTGLAAITPAVTATLRTLVSGAARTSARLGQHPGGTLTVRRPDGLRPLELLVSPIHLEHLHPMLDSPVALVYVSDPEANARAIRAELQRRFGLTTAESRVAEFIGRGLTVRQIADTSHLSPHTVRTQLKATLAKTVCSRQVELIRLMSSLANGRFN